MAIWIALSRTKLDCLKRHLRAGLPPVRSGHMDEAIAVSLGFRTYASLLASLKVPDDAPVQVTGWLDPPTMESKLRAFGYEEVGAEFLGTLIEDAMKDPKFFEAESERQKRWAMLQAFRAANQN